MNELIKTITHHLEHRRECQKKAWWTAWRALLLGNATLSAPLMTVQFYKGLMKVYAIQTNVLEGSAEVVEHKNKTNQPG